MKIKIRIGAAILAFLFFFLVFVVIIYADYTGGSQNSLFPTLTEVFLGLGFAAIIAMLLGK